MAPRAQGHGTRSRGDAEKSGETERGWSGFRVGLRPPAGPGELGETVPDRNPALRWLAHPNPPSVSSVSLWCIPSIPASAVGGVCEAHRRLHAPATQGRAEEDKPQRQLGHGGEDRYRPLVVPPRLGASALRSSFPTHPGNAEAQRRGGAEMRRGAGRPRGDGPAPRSARQDKGLSSSCPPCIFPRLCPRPWGASEPGCFRAPGALRGDRHRCASRVVIHHSSFRIHHSKGERTTPIVHPSPNPAANRGDPV